MKDAQIPVQAAIYAALTANSYISTNNIGVYDMVPKGTSTPFITIGDMTTVDNSTMGIFRQTISLMIHSWDQDLSQLKLKTMMGAILDTLHDQPLTLSSGHYVSIIRYMSSQVLKDPDGLTVHGIQKFNINVEAS
jgi:hypothetical protein